MPPNHTRSPRVCRETLTRASALPSVRAPTTDTTARDSVQAVARGHPLRCRRDRRAGPPLHRRTSRPRRRPAARPPPRASHTLLPSGVSSRVGLAVGALATVRARIERRLGRALEAVRAEPPELAVAIRTRGRPHRTAGATSTAPASARSAGPKAAGTSLKRSSRSRTTSSLVMYQRRPGGRDGGRQKATNFSAHDPASPRRLGRA